MLRTAASMLVLALLSAPVAAETVYVDDTLRVGVRKNPNSTETPLQVVTSGAALDVLERGNGYFRVRTSEGTEGWVSAVYVTSNAPARALLEQERASNAKLQGEINDLRRGGAAAMEDGEQLRAQVAELLEENGALHAQLSKSYAGAISSPFGWIWESAVMVALFAVGIMLGKRHERQRIAKRLNGFEL